MTDQPHHGEPAYDPPPGRPYGPPAPRSVAHQPGGGTPAAQPPTAPEETTQRLTPQPRAAQPRAAQPQSAPAPTAPPAPDRPTDSTDFGARRGTRARPSPIIPPGILPAALTTLLAALLAGAVTLPRPVFALAVLPLQLLTAAGWFRLNGMWPARQGIALAFLAGVAVDVTLLVVPEEHTGAAVFGTLGSWALLALLLHLRNRSSPDERLYALTAMLTATALTVLAAGYLALSPVSTHAVLVGTTAVAVGTLVRALPAPAYVGPLVAALAAAGAGWAVSGATDVGRLDGALLGLAVGVCAVIGLRVASYDFPSRFVHLTAGVALPLSLAAPAVYVLGRATS